MKKLLLTAAVLLAACGATPSPTPSPSPTPTPAPAPTPTPAPTLSGLWTGKLTFSNNTGYTIWVNFTPNTDPVMVFQEQAGNIKQRSASTVFNPSTRAVTVNWLDTLYSCAQDTSQGTVNGTLSTDGTSITGTFNIGSDGLDTGTVSLTPTTLAPTNVKSCP